MLRGLRYFFSEALTSLWRGKWSAALSVITIAAGLLVLGFFLIVNSNLQKLVARWSDAAELSVFLGDDATPEQLQAVANMVDRSGLAASRQYVSKEEAASRFRQDFPDLAAATARLERNPFPASLEVRLNQRARAVGSAVDNLATSLGGMAGVADVRYDRRWLGRLNTAIGFVRAIGIILVAMLAVAAALTVANVETLLDNPPPERVERVTQIVTFRQIIDTRMRTYLDTLHGRERHLSQHAR